MEFPKYYKTDNPDTLVVEFKDRRINDVTGKEEFLVRRKTSDGKDLGTHWEEKDELVQDAVGPVYAERGGLFGVLHDTYGKSTYDRIRVMTSYEHSLTRLNLHERRSKRAVGAISYDKGYPVAVTHEVEYEVEVEDHDDDRSTGSDADESEPIEEEEMSKAKVKSSQKTRQRTPQSKKKA